MTTARIPHLRITVLSCAIAVAGYASFSVWVVFTSGDQAMIGDVVGTWKSFAVAAFSFWLGSSSGGKSKEDIPTKVQIEQPPDKPVPVDQETKP